MPTVSRAERLPTVNGDSDSWGTVLNGFLGVTLDSAGYIKSSVVNSTHVVDGSINSTDILDDTISAGDIATNGVTTTEIADSTITTTDISASAGITDGQISDTLTIDGTGSVTFSSLTSYPTGCTNQFVTTIGDSLTCASVASASITDGSVSLADHATSSVNSTHIVDNSINSTDVAGLMDVDLNDDFGDFTCTGSAAGCTVDANAIALGTDTVNNYVATVADDGQGTLSVSGSGAENAAVTAGVAVDSINTRELADSIDLSDGSESSLVFTGSGAGPLYYFMNTAVDATANDIMQIQFSSISSANLGTDDTFISFQSSAGELGDISGTVTELLVAYNTFTGGHWSQTKEINLEEGEVLVSTGELLTNSVQLPKVTRTNKAKDSRVYGVYGGSKGNSSNVAYGDGREIIQVLALGTGVIRVTDTNGNINNGDLITTSTRAGYGQKQDDDLMHSYTVAKATESVDWNKIKKDPIKGFKWKLIAATYHSG